MPLQGSVTSAGHVAGRRPLFPSVGGDRLVGGGGVVKAAVTASEQRRDVWLGRAVLVGRSVRWWWWSLAQWPVTVMTAWVLLWVAPAWLSAVGAVVGVAVDWWAGRVYPVWASWRMGCRWRRRWPVVWRRVTRVPATDPVAVPRLGLVPRLGPTLIEWRLRPPAGGKLPDVAALVAELAAADSNVVAVEVDWRRPTDSRGVLRVAFVDELERVEVPSWAS